MKLHVNLEPDLIGIDCNETTTEGLLRELISLLSAKKKISDEKNILAKLMEREKLGSTSIGNHAAVPHTKLKELKEPIVCIGISKNGLVYNESDKQVVHLVILILSPNNSPIVHLQILAAAAALVKKSKSLIKELIAVKTASELIEVVKKYETLDD